MAHNCHITQNEMRMRLGKFGKISTEQLKRNILSRVGVKESTQFLIARA